MNMHEPMCHNGVAKIKGMHWVAGHFQQRATEYSALWREMIY